MSTTTLRTLLEENATAVGPDLIRHEEGAIRCLACGHRCLIKPDRTGVCRVRFNRNGELRAPAGYVAGIQVDPIEKKPFYHAYPGRNAFSFGMLGCDFHCGYCQNWVTSQALRDDQAISAPQRAAPDDIVDLAVKRGVRVMVSTYNEPLITSEWAVEIFRRAREKGIACGYVSNGNGTREVLDFIRPFVDLYKVDLKSFDDRHYRELGGVLSNVLATIEQLIERKFWVEIVTLVIPGFNDGDNELAAIAGFLAGISRDIPWHVTAFHPDYKMTEPGRTPAATLIRAYDIGRAAGLRYVYPGNIHGGVGDRESTRCPKCNAFVIERVGFYVRRNRMTSPGRCPDCNEPIAGVFEPDAPRRSEGTGIPLPVMIQ